MCSHAGLDHLHKSASDDYSLRPIKSLCCIDRTCIQYPCLQYARSLEPILSKYYFLSDRFQSVIFTNIWSSAIDKLVKSGLKLTVDDLKSNLWDPVFKECRQLIEGLHSEEIKLNEIDYYFRRLDYMDGHLKEFHKAMEACHDGPLNVGNWIASTIDKIKLYWSLCDQSKAAMTVLDLKKSLELSGDFCLIEDIAKRASTSMADAQLKDIDDRMYQAKTFLASFTTERLECLRAFSRCMELVKWIQQETQG